MRLIQVVATGFLVLHFAGCGGPTEEWKKGRAQFELDREKVDQDTYAEKELSETITYDAKKFLKDKRHEVLGVDPEYTENLVEKLYNSACRNVQFTSVEEEYIYKKVRGQNKKYVSKRTSSIIVVELPELTADRRNVFDAHVKLSEKMGYIQTKDVGQKYLAFELE